MLSKHTQKIFSRLSKLSHIKTPAFDITKAALNSSLPQNPHWSLYNNFHQVTRFSFSNSSNKDDPNDPNKPTQSTEDQPEKAEQKPDTTEPAQKNEAATKETETKTEAPVKKTKAAASAKPKIEDKKLKSVPIRPIKLPLKPEEEKVKPETYVLFSSNTPIIPYSQQSGLIKTGNLSTNHISNKLAFFIQNELGEIYTVGLVLEDNVNKSLQQDFSKEVKTTGQSLEDKNKHKANISTKDKDYKIKLIEIEFKDNCIFAKGIPYKDTPLTANEKKVKVPELLGEIRELAKSIRNYVALEKIDVLNNFFTNFPDDETVDARRLDEILCYVLGECYKLSNYTKEGLQPFVELFLEERSPMVRMTMIKKKLEEIRNVLEIVNKSVQSGDKIWKSQDNEKAKLSFEYIRSNYFSSEKPSSQASQSTTQNMTGQAKKFMEQLPLIKDEVSREKVKKEIERFALQDKMSGEYHKLLTYLDDVFSIPWDNYSEEYWDDKFSEKVLEKELFGLHKVKERIIEMIAVNRIKRVGEPGSSTTPEQRKGFVILLNGPPGTGKTTIAKAIATALKRESRFISFAGVTDPSFVKGHKRTYVDAQPGVFIKELVKAKTMNPVFILDEVDKLSRHHQGVDPYYALMEILNPEENHNFTDHYLDIKVDFSNVIFILTANQVLNMLEPLRNRLEIIDVPPYIEQEKLLIGKQYLLPAVLKENGLDTNNVSIDDENLGKIIQGWCYYESGVRELRRCLDKLSRKHAFEILDKYSHKEPELVIEQTNVHVETPQEAKVEDVVEGETGAEKTGEAEVKTTTPEEEQNKKEVQELIKFSSNQRLVIEGSSEENDELLKKYLGLPVFDDMHERKNRKVHPGTVNVLTVSGFVGHVLSVECVFDKTSPEKKGQFNCSGNLQKVLQESLTIAKIVAMKFLSPEQLKEMSEKNIHIHFLSGASPKDGPSAGLSICTAILSLLLNKPISANISMTGELSLNEEVYKIGGVQAKVTASKALGINKVILPYGNKSDFFELPKLLKEDLEVYFVREYNEVFDIVFGDDPKKLERIEKVVNGEHILPIKIPAESESTISVA